MSSTPTPEAPPLSRLLSRPVLISGGALLFGVVLAWLWLLQDHAQVHHSTDMPGMPEMAMAVDHWSANYLLPTFVMWALMMVAMMLPSAAPMILLHARIDRGSAAERTRDSLLFMAMYLAVWLAFSALATIAQAALMGSDLIDAAELKVGERYLAAALLVGAAIWQLTSAKAVCLERCQSPILFVTRYWRPGLAGAARLGLVHGLFCLGCCWSLMLLLFAGGVMNLAAIAALAAMVFAEKLAPPSWHLERWVAALLVAVAVAIAER